MPPPSSSFADGDEFVVDKITPPPAAGNKPIPADPTDAEFARDLSARITYLADTFRMSVRGQQQAGNNAQCQVNPRFFVPMPLDEQVFDDIRTILVRRRNNPDEARPEALANDRIDNAFAWVAARVMAAPDIQAIAYRELAEAMRRYPLYLSLLFLPEMRFDTSEEGLYDAYVSPEPVVYQNVRPLYTFVSVQDATGLRVPLPDGTLPPETTSNAKLLRSLIFTALDYDYTSDEYAYSPIKFIYGMDAVLLAVYLLSRGTLPNLTLYAGAPGPTRRQIHLTPIQYAAYRDDIDVFTYLFQQGGFTRVAGIPVGPTVETFLAQWNTINIRNYFTTDGT